MPIQSLDPSRSMPEFSAEQLRSLIAGLIAQLDLPSYSRALRKRLVRYANRISHPSELFAYLQVIASLAVTCNSSSEYVTYISKNNGAITLTICHPEDRTVIEIEVPRQNLLLESFLSVLFGRSYIVPMRIRQFEEHPNEGRTGKSMPK
jgi:hypothetical protein